MPVTIQINTKKCPMCGKSGTLRVTSDGYKIWQEGAYIQDAFPLLTAVERERLISGYCGPCWDAEFPKE